MNTKKTLKLTSLASAALATVAVAQSQVHADDVQASDVQSQPAVNETAQAVTPVTDADVQASQAKVDDANQAVADQEAVVANQEQAVANTQAELDQTPVVTDSDIQVVEDSKTSTDAQIADTESQIEATDQDIADQTQIVADAETKLADATQTTADAQAQADATQANIASTKSELDTINNEQIPDFEVSSEYANALKQYADLQSTNQLDSEEGQKVQTILAKEGKKLFDTNKTKLPAVNSNDTVGYDIDNLPADVQSELTLYATNIINAMQDKFGVSKFTPSVGIQKFANKIAQNYRDDHWEYYKGHDEDAINRNASDYGIKSKTYNAYENADAVDVPNQNIGDEKKVIFTKSYLKNMIANNILRFTFANDEWEHAVSISGVATDSKRRGMSPQTYFAISFSKDPGQYIDEVTSHFIVVNGRNIEDASKFDTTPIVSNKDAEKQALQDKLSTLNATYANQLLKVEQAKAVQNGAQSAVTIAKNKASELAQTKANQEAKLVDLKAQADKQASTEQALKDTQAKRNSLTAKLTVAKSALTVETEKLDDLKATASDLQAAHNKLVAAYNAYKAFEASKPKPADKPADKPAEETKPVEETKPAVTVATAKTDFTSQVKAVAARVTTQKLSEQVLERRGTKATYQASLPETGDSETTSLVATILGAGILVSAFGMTKKREN